MTTVIKNSKARQKKAYPYEINSSFQKRPYKHNRETGKKYFTKLGRFEVVMKQKACISRKKYRGTK